MHARTPDRKLAAASWPTGLAVAAAVLTQGCMPAAYTQLPPVRGRVTDAAGRPVAGAEIVACRFRLGDDATPIPLATTDAAGAFAAAEQRRWALLVVGQGPISENVDVFARSGSRLSVVQTVPHRMHAHPFGLGGPDDVIDLRDFRLPD